MLAAGAAGAPDAPDAAAGARRSREREGAVRVDVVFGAAAIGAAEVVGRVVAVIDVLRASTTIAAALAHGARSVVPLEGPDAVLDRSRAFARGDVRLAGERRMRPVPGFDLGNSPGEFTREAVSGCTVLLATTNGTPALLAAHQHGARDVIAAAYANFSPALAFLRSALRGGVGVTIVCAGQDRQFALEDAACAGRFVRGLARRRAGSPRVAPNDAARTCALIDRRYRDDFGRLFGDAAHARALAGAGFADDLAHCAGVDRYPVLPVLVDRQLVAIGPAWGR